MNTVIHISQEGIHAIHGEFSKGTFTIDYLDTFPLPEESMINGVIADEHALTSALQKLHGANIDKVMLVIGSGNILLKNIKVPKMSKQRLLNFTKDELSSLENANAEDYIYDYAVLNDTVGRGGEILCCGVERSLIKSHLDVFEGAGIKIQSIDVSVYAICKLVTNLKEFHNKTYILNIIDGNNLVTLLFVDNQYTFHNRNRLFAERGSEALISEITRHTSQMIQFAKSQLRDISFDAMYISGVKANESGIYDMIQSIFQVPGLPFPKSSDLVIKDEHQNVDGYLFCIGTLVRK